MRESKEIIIFIALSALLLIGIGFCLNQLLISL